MTRKHPTDEAIRNKDGSIDRRAEQMDPVGKRHTDENHTGPKRAQKKAGQDLGDPQQDEAHDDAE